MSARPAVGSILRVAAVVTFGAAFFSAPLIVTFDSAHFLGYLPVLRGEVPMSEWDVARGPGFPLWLLAMRALLGTGPGGALVVSMLCLISLVAALRVTFSNTLPVWKPWWVAAAVVVALDATSFGYFHVLLTESLAATLFAVGLAFAAVRMKRWGSQQSLNLGLEACAALLAAFAYQVKQPYVAAFLFPQLFSAAWALRHGLGWKRALMPLAFTSVVVVAAVVGWSRMLPNAGAAGDASRGTSSLLANNLASTCLRPATGLFYDTGATVLVCSDPAWRSEPRAEGFELERRCSDGVLSAGEVAAICGHSLLVAPHRLAFELMGGLRELLSMGKVREHLGSGEEHWVIAHKVFRIRPEEPNVFWLPEPLRLRAESYSQPGAQTGRLVRWLGVLARPSLWFHAALGISSFLLALVALWWTWRRGSTPERAPGLVWVAASTSASYSLTLAALGTTIDRYQFPVFPVTLVAVALALAVGRARRMPAATASALAPGA